MKRYVVVSDLIINGGQGCTVLKEEPNEDHITIEVTDYTSVYMRKVLITHDNNDIHYTQGSVWREVSVPDSCKIVDDLNNARMELFRNKICRGCKHFQQDFRTLQRNSCCECGEDNLDNFKKGSCPEMLDGYYVFNPYWMDHLDEMS